MPAASRVLRGSQQSPNMFLFANPDYRCRTKNQEEETSGYSQTYGNYLPVCKAVQAYLSHCHCCNISKKQQANSNPLEGIATSEWNRLKKSLHNSTSVLVLSQSGGSNDGVAGNRPG